MNKPNKKEARNAVVIRNKKARFEYEFVDTYVAGLVLKGTEIKSIRAGKASINEAYCFVQNNEVFVKNMHIAHYEWASFVQHEAKALRKLLLNKKEIRKMLSAVQGAGITAVPLKLFINERGLAKLEIAVVRGKKLHDKRQTIKERDTKIMLDRIKKKHV